MDPNFDSPAAESDHRPQSTLWGRLERLIVVYLEQDPADRHGLFSTEFMLAALGVLAGLVLLLLGHIDQGVELIKWTIGLYAGGRSVYKALKKS